MSESYRAISWNRQKRLYDGVVLAGLLLYLGAFAASYVTRHPTITPETVAIRGTGTAALLLLHIVLCIGPLARLNRRFLPLLYNRRHLGVVTFSVGAVHALLVTVQYHTFGVLDPITSLLASNPRFDSIAQFPFEWLGMGALLVLFAMAATSHDFWLAQLSAPVWKALHMSVYLAYGMLVMHVALGLLQAETSPALVWPLALGFGVVFGLHLIAGWKERALDAEWPQAQGETWVDIGPVADIPEKRAKIVTLSGERVAVFRYDGKISALSNVCQHQNGPLGEGCILDGLVTCPWHGYQYGPSDGASPPPFQEQVPTFHTRVMNGRVEVDPRPLPPGTQVEPARSAT